MEQVEARAGRRAFGSRTAQGSPTASSRGPSPLRQGRRRQPSRHTQCNPGVSPSPAPRRAPP
eukprot:15184216-Alexandrium_andersonii.AAC.1